MGVKGKKVSSTLKPTVSVREFVKMNRVKRIDIENAMIADALSRGIDRFAMYATGNLRLEWKLLQSTVSSVDRASLDDEKNCLVLTIKTRDVFHLPYTENGIQLARAIVQFYN